MTTDLEKEREAFEAAYAPIFVSNNVANMPRRQNGEYVAPQQQIAWMMWQARAALTAPASTTHEHKHLGAASVEDQAIYDSMAANYQRDPAAAPAAPQEQPSDRDIALIWDQSTDEINVPELRIQGDLLPLILAHSRALLSRYGAAPQGWEDAESVAKIFHPAPCKGLNCGSTDGRTHSAECEAQHAAAIAGGTFIPSNLAIPQPAGWGARGMSDEP